MKKLSISILTAIALAVLPAAAVVAQQQPSDQVEGVNITAPSSGSTVGAKFTISGTIRADLGCHNNAYLGISSPGETGFRGLVDSAGFRVNTQNNTFTWYVDATQPPQEQGGGAGGTVENRIRPGTTTFTLVGNGNCGSDSITVTLAPVGGVATGAGGLR